MKRLTVDDTKKAINAVGKPIKEIEEKVNPLEEKVDKNNTTDSGTESLKLANQTAKTANKTVKTTKSAVKTTKNVVKSTPKVIKKTAKTTKEVAKATAKAAKVTVKATVKAVEVTVKVAAKVITEIAAALSNPYVFIVVLIIVVIILLIYGFFLILSGGDTEQKAMTQPIGLGNIEEQYNNGLEYYNTALDERMNELTELINNLEYDSNNRKDSDLLVYTRYKPGTLFYQKDFPTDYRKNSIISTFDHQFADDDIDEFLAIAYVYCEKKENKENGTYLRIYEVEFTQDVFNDMIEECIPFSDVVSEHQECPKVDCIHDKKAGAEWQKALDGINEWDTNNDENGDKCILEIIKGCKSKEEIIDYVEWRIKGYWKDFYGEIYTEDVNIESYADADDYYSNYLFPTYRHYETTYYNSTACDNTHTLHSIETSFLDADDLMDALDFDANEKQWVELTKLGFEQLGVDNDET